MFDSVLQATSVSKSFQQGHETITVLQDLNLTVAEGETLAIMGVSGSGKSTLLHLLAGLDSPDSGEILVAGRSLNELDSAEMGRVRNKHIGFVYQFHHLLPEFSAEENVAMPLIIGGAEQGRALQSARELLERVGLSHRLAHHPNALSGGERQRVAIARALANQPSLVLADEPTGNLDEDSASQVHQLMIELASNLGVAFVVVTHDPKLAGLMDRCLKLHSGRLE